MAKAKKKALPLEMTGPAILGRECDSKSTDAGIVYTWRRGPVLVEIEPSTSGKKPDYRVSVWLFPAEHREPVLQDWRATPEAAARWAWRKLAPLRDSLAGVL